MFKDEGKDLFREMTSEENAKSEEQYAKVKAFAESMGWEYWQICGMKKAPEDKFAISVFAVGQADHIGIMTMALVNRMNNSLAKAAQDKEAQPGEDGMASRIPTINHPEIKC